MRILVAALALAFASQAAAQAYPSKPIRWIVVGGAGGAFDLVTRALAPPMGTGLGQPMVVDNRASASGIVGMDAAAKSPPDGYTTLTAGNPQSWCSTSIFSPS
jgi:tripartite-type tricarboxylate transporter receptor subunit TctC